MQMLTIPKDEYNAFLSWKRNVRVRLDESWFWTPEWQKKEAEANDDIRKSKVSGPFSDIHSLMLDLKGRRK